MFIVEFAPELDPRDAQPVVRLLAAVPSVIYGLIGILVLVPFVGNHMITRAQKESVAVRDPARRLQHPRRRSWS